MEELPYRADYAKSSRAICRCCHKNIEKNTLRCAIMVQVWTIYLFNYFFLCFPSFYFWSHLPTYLSFWLLKKFNLHIIILHIYLYSINLIFLAFIILSMIFIVIYYIEPLNHNLLIKILFGWSLFTNMLCVHKRFAKLEKILFLDKLL